MTGKPYVLHTETTHKPEAVSVYIHVPFCTQKCPYCHFFSVLPTEKKIRNYLSALSTHWQAWQPKLADHRLVSIYFGGGTPSLLPPEAIQEVLSQIRPPPNIEITLEANPESLTQQKMTDLRKAGINRLSIGIQSFDDTLLHTLKRRHTATQAIKCVQSASKYFNNLSIDLMYDLPGQTLKSWRSTLSQAASLPLTHLSLYNLVFEEGTPFFRGRHELITPGEELAAEMYAYARSFLPARGFRQYEISAFAKEEYRSHHNTGYWLGRPFIGLGPAAFSYWEGRRVRNIANLPRYCENPTQVDFEEKLEMKAAKRELLAVGLRMLEGVDLETFGPLEPETVETLETLIQDGLLEKKHSLLKLTDRGVFFYDTVAAELI